ncbi:putative protein kinase [Trypanosoma conorhini]|uniref:non-specific serine/threonine protein kinase n=1 Tax=Trypanosoma conorhini TaxID=83891 RepID=A0A422Q9R8_9TRYP|nr:putative protein kinase [Trypanosoma conorhini]RNF26694.1 putative protein kinase [Trypanosoma conorhini]
MRFAGKRHCEGPSQGCDAFGFAAAPPWRAAAAERLAALLSDVQLLRLLTLTMEFLCCQRPSLSMQQIKAGGQEAAALSTQDFFNGFMLVKGRVLLAMHQLRSLSLSLCEKMGENRQLFANLLAALQGWEAAAGIFGRDGGFLSDCPELVAALDDVAAHVEGALVELRGGGKTVAAYNSAVVAFTKEAEEVEGDDRLRATPLSNGWCDGYGISDAPGAFSALVRRIGLDVRAILSTAGLRSLLAAFVIVAGVPVVQLFLDLHALRAAGPGVLLGSNCATVSPPHYSMSAVRVFLSALQLLLLLGMGLVFLILLSTAASSLARAAALRALCLQGSACFVRCTGQTPFGTNDVVGNKRDECEEEDEDESENGMSLTVRNAVVVEKDLHPQFPATHPPCGEEYAKPSCGGVSDGDLRPAWRPYSQARHDQSLCASPVAAPPAGCHAGSKAALPDLVESEVETPSPPLGAAGADADAEEEEEEASQEDGSLRLRCRQAERERQELLTEAPSGVADKYKDFSPYEKADRTARICRHLTENVQDCVCPLLIVEYVPRARASGESFKPMETRDRYPVVYCNFPALELLHYRWLTDLAGKELKDVFGLYHNPRSSSQSRRNKGRNMASALPALPQRQRRSSKERLILVPSPPSKEQGQWERSQSVEKIADLRCLFENGVEELLTARALQDAGHFDVYAMSINNVTLPSSFCDPGQPLTLPQSTEKMYLVLLFLREINKEARDDASRRLSNSRVRGVSAPQATAAQESTMGDRFNDPMQKRASTANAVTPSLSHSRGSLLNDGEPDSTDSQAGTSQRGRSSRTAPGGHRRAKRRSTIKGYSSPISAERGHSVDQITAQQLREKLSSLIGVRTADLSPRVPESFLINFVALMIFVNRVLKRYKRVNCVVDAENMFILLELRTVDGVPLAKRNSRALENAASLPLPGSGATEGESQRSSLYDAGVDSLLSPNLLEYLRACDATIHFTASGCTLRFPYTTQERLALMEDAGTLQLSTLRGLSLFGVTATNALTEDAAAQSSGKTIHLHQYAAAEKAFSEAVRKAKRGSVRKSEENAASAPSNVKTEFFSKPDGSSGVAGAVAVPLVHSVDELSVSSVESVTRLPHVFSGGHSKTTFPVANRATLVPALESRSGFDTNQAGTPEWPSASAFAHVDNVFGKSLGRSWSDAMATSISSHGPLIAKVTSYYKRYLHFFLYLKADREDVVQNLWTRGHSATVVNDPATMKRYLLIGMGAFDVVFIEWSEWLVTPEIRELIVEDAGSKTTMLYLLNEDTYSLPLPPGTPDEAVLRLRDIGEIFTNPTIGQNLSLYIRQRRLRQEMVQIRWRKSYQIVRQIGGGAFGDVYEVYLFVSRGRLAMKRMFLNGASNRLLEQLNREVLIMSQLDHPNIVSFSHSSMEDNAYCIFMELCDGTLRERLQRGFAMMQQDTPRLQKPPLPRLSNGASFPLQAAAGMSNRPETDPDELIKISEPLTAREIVLVLRDVASGIAYIHSKGIVHRDIKPCNILFSSGVAKIGDFGSAAEECAAKPLVNMKGTLAYMSPEVLLGEPYGRPCDMWSFGCLLAEIIGLRLGHLQGLHFPALVELYTSIPQAGSLPITVANYKGGKLQHHIGTTAAQMLLGAMKSACHDACSKRSESSTWRRGMASVNAKESLSSGEKQATAETKFQSSMSCDSARAVTYITANSTTFLGSEKAELPESLVELLESLFQRDPQKRMTAEEVLHHPVTWDVEWMEMVIRAVEEICPLDADDALVDASQAGDASAEEAENLDLSISSV